MAKMKGGRCMSSLFPAACPSPRLCRAAVRECLRQCHPFKLPMRLTIATSLSCLSIAPSHAALFPSELDLASLQMANGGDGSMGVVIKGVAESDYSGFAGTT